MTGQNKETEITRSSLELLYEISRELVNALDLSAVLQHVVLLSMRNIGAISGTIIVVDDGGQAIESIIVNGEQILERTTSRLRVTLERGLAGWVARHKQAVIIPNTNNDERWLQRHYDDQKNSEPKSALSIPLLVRERLIGVITLVHPTPGFFTTDHQSLMQAIADQAGISVLNARLYTESQRQARVMTAVAESATVITATLQLDDVLQRILEQISQALRVEVVSLALLDSTEKVLEFRASTGGKGQSIIGLRLPVDRGVAGWVAREGRGAIVQEVRNEPRWYADIDRSTGFETQAIACAPIRSRGTVIGVMEALNPIDGQFDPDALLVLTGIGSLAGTAIRHAQLFESLQAAHQRYRDLFQDSIDTILITDWKGQILEANHQAELTTGFNNESLLQMYVDQLHSLDIEKVGDNFNLISTDRTVMYESTLHSQIGIEIPVQVYIREVKIENVSHLQWTLHDISERKNLDNMRDDLISMIYHDLRSPLANVVSSLDVLDSMLPNESDPSLRSLLNIAVRSTERIQRLTNSLLDINRLEAGQPVGNRHPAAPVMLVTDAVDAVMPIVKNKSQELTQNLPGDLPLVLVDSDMIKRVLSNLLENAVKFTPPGGKIVIGAQTEEDMVLMYVQDTGPGIPVADRERIFDKYTRLHAKDGPKGFGLGLAYCHLAVNGHGGRIWIDNQTLEGSRFCFTLPIARE